jgi:CRP/FNR family transcriptional regulator, polysaccharide utilization system transcription regulator
VSAASCVTCALRTTGAFSDLSLHALGSCIQNARTDAAYDSRQIIFYEGKPCHGIHLLCEGRVKLYRSTFDGKQQILRIIGPCAVIDPRSVFDRDLHAATCETIEPSRVSFIDRSAFQKLLKEHHVLALSVIRWLAADLDRSYERLLHSTSKTARQRLADLLMDLSRDHGTQSNGGIDISLSLKREELAELSDLTLETVVRQLAAFRRDGILKTEGRRITVLNPARLAKISRRNDTNKVAS